MLFLVATPIGHLEDISARGLRVLREAAVIAAEDTREARKLLDRYEIATPVVSLHEHNEHERTAELTARLQAGESVAVISDAGMPVIRDPGYLLVRAAIEAGIPVVPIPGPNAIITALAASGLPTDPFYFGGYLPDKEKARREAVAAVKSLPATLVYYETPHRVRFALADLIAVLGDREAVLAREMTKIHETFERGRLSEILARLPDPVKGEITLVIAGASAAQRWTEEEVTARLKSLLDSGAALKAASAELAETTGWSKNEIYKMGIGLKER